MNELTHSAELLLDIEEAYALARTAYKAADIALGNASPETLHDKALQNPQAYSFDLACKTMSCKAKELAEAIQDIERKRYSEDRLL